jgi:hypothetical protein
MQEIERINSSNEEFDKILKLKEEKRVLVETEQEANLTKKELRDKVREIRDKMTIMEQWMKGMELKYLNEGFAGQEVETVKKSLYWKYSNLFSDEKRVLQKLGYLPTAEETSQYEENIQNIQKYYAAVSQAKEFQQDRKPQRRQKNTRNTVAKRSEAELAHLEKKFESFEKEWHETNEKCDQKRKRDDEEEGLDLYGRKVSWTGQPPEEKKEPETSQPDVPPKPTEQDILSQLKLSVPETSVKKPEPKPLSDEELLKQHLQQIKNERGIPEFSELPPSKIVKIDEHRFYVNPKQETTSEKETKKTSEKETKKPVKKTPEEEAMMDEEELKKVHQLRRDLKDMKLQFDIMKFRKEKEEYEAALNRFRGKENFQCFFVLIFL